MFDKVVTGDQVSSSVSGCHPPINIQTMFSISAFLWASLSQLFLVPDLFKTLDLGWNPSWQLLLYYYDYYDYQRQDWTLSALWHGLATHCTATVLYCCFVFCWFSDIETLLQLIPLRLAEPHRATRTEHCFVLSKQTNQDAFLLPHQSTISQHNLGGKKHIDNVDTLASHCPLPTSY